MVEKKKFKISGPKHRSDRFVMPTASALATRTAKTTPFQKQLARSGHNVWWEANDAEGRSYYWNIKTKVTTWEKPPGGYLTINEQKCLGIEAPVSQYEAVQESVIRKRFR